MSASMALEAELVFATASRGISWDSIQDMELWQIAAALGLHRVETRAQRDEREIVDSKRDEWERDGQARTEYMTGYAERRAASRRARQQQKRQGEAGR